MNFSQAIKSSLIEKYATFKGRACRAEWWYFNLFIILVAIAVSAVVAFATFGSVDWEYVATLNETQATEFILDTNFGTATKLTSVLLALIFFIPSMSVTIRRLQDLDASYYWVAPYFLAKPYRNLDGIVSFYRAFSSEIRRSRQLNFYNLLFSFSKARGLRR